MLEYVVLLGGLLRLEGGFFNFDTILGLASIVVSAVGVIILGYLIKGVWGAIAAFSMGTFLFCYFKGLLPY